MVVTSNIIVKSTDEVPELIDITDRIRDAISSSGVANGQVTVFSQHTTAAIIIQENEEGIHKDLKKFLTTLLPSNGDYHHSAAPDHIEDRRPNGHSHLQHFLLGGSSQVLPVVGGRIQLGEFQRVFLVELDRARTRNVIVQVVGE